MLDLLIWLSRLETALAASLSSASLASAGSTRHLKKVASGKRKLSRAIVSTASKVKASRRRPPLLHGLSHLREDAEASFHFLAEAIKSGMDGQELAEAIALHEYNKWNGLFLALAAILKEDFPEGVPVLARAQRQKKAVERFLEATGTRHGLFKLRASEPVWRERFLVIGGASPSIAEGLRQDGIVESALDGKDAIERLRERYYGVLVADEDLPDLSGVELCRKAGRMFPGIEERFLFLYGALENRKRAGKRGRSLHKSASRDKLLEEVGIILDR